MNRRAPLLLIVIIHLLASAPAATAWPDGESIVAALVRIGADRATSGAMARHNRDEAEKFRSDRFVTSVEQILVEVAG